MVFRNFKKREWFFCKYISRLSSVKKTLKFIRENKIKAGVAINPKTPNKKIIEILDDADMVLIMTVEPGFSGQKFIEGCMEKVKELRQLNTFYKA